MKNFVISLFPNRIPRNIDPSDQLLVLREKILQIILISTAGLGCVFYIFSISQSLKRSPIFLNIIGLMVLFLIGVIILRVISFKIRSWIVILILYALTFSALAIYGVDGSGMLLALSVSVIVFLIRGALYGVGMSLFNVATVIIIGWLMVRGIIPPPPTEYEFNSTMVGGWLNTGLAFVVLTTALMVTVVTMVQGMQRAVEKQKQLSRELMDERNSLEDRISRRTKDAERRALQLEIASSIAREISQETNLDRLLDTAVEQIRERFTLYYVAIFLVDDQDEYAVLRAGTGEAGRAMLERHHQLKVGQMGLVGFVVANNEFRLAQDVKSDATHYENPYLPATQSEVALPLRLEGKVIGVLDLQSIQKDYFSEDDIKAMQITADQIAVAIQRARLVDQLEQSLANLEKGLGQYTQQSWSTFLNSARKKYAYRFSQSKIEEDISPSIESAEALRSGKPVLQESPVSSTEVPRASAAIPIRLRNQVLGVLDVRFESQKIPPEMIPLLEVASDRLALALENARLLEDIKSRIESDRIVSDISGRVRSATNIDSVLKTAALELGKNFGLSEVIVQLKSSS